ncbi:unnamed protein product [Arctogadus glacialis]
MWKNLPSEDWKDKAQQEREDRDTGLAEPNKCPNCQITFTRQKDLKFHQRGCHECVCDICNETFQHEKKLERHKNKNHKQQYQCDHCKKNFAEKRNLARHANACTKK